VATDDLSSDQPTAINCEALLEILLAERPDDVFGRLARLAQHLLGAPAALISLIEPGQHHLLSAQGLPPAWAGRQNLPFSHSICRYVVERAAPLVIADVRACPLVANSPSIGECNLGAYLGVPMVTVTDTVFGVLCVMDNVARDWSADDIERLLDIGHAVSAAVDARIHHWRSERADARRRETEARMRERDEILTLAERSAGIGVWDIDLASNMVRGTPQFFHILGLEPKGERIPIELLRQLRHPDDREMVVQGFRRVVESGMDSYEIEYRILRPDGQIRWIFGRGRVIRDGAGTPVRYSGIDIDITERKQAEEHRLLLVNELNHRVKNTLATVQAIAAQTFRGPDQESARIAFEGRIQALSQAHDILTSQNWSGAGLHQVIAATLRPFTVDDKGYSRISLTTTDVSLSSKAALALSMALHELATNAVKYGALSNDGGRIEILGRVEEGNLHLSWREIGGPAVVPPRRTGFGSHLIKRALPRQLNGEVRLDHLPEGVVCEIRIPVSVDWMVRS
jgi:PAS domain S-box-containing protein